MPPRTMFLRLISITGLLLPALAAPQVKIGTTTLTGRGIPSLQQEFFGGIPFAKPPIGALRFEPPVLTTLLNVSNFDASQFGKGCIATEGNDTSEDCLFINVYRPPGIDHTAKLPVMFWTFGGGFTHGSSSDPAYNGSQIVFQSIQRGTPIIFVSFNYRLGPLGFPQGEEAGSKGKLNLGLKDQLTALKWVQANIGSFGGDRLKVTVFGQSGGAIMTGIQLLDPNIKNVARAAILESGTGLASTQFKASDTQDDWQNFVSGVPSCSSLSTSNSTFDCLKNATSADLLAAWLAAISLAQRAVTFTPNIDGPGGFLPDIVSRLLGAGHFSRLPFIAGATLDEGANLVDKRFPISEAFIRQFLQASYSPRLVDEATVNATFDKLLQLYPDDPSVGSPYNTGNDTFGVPGYKRAASILGDLTFQAPRRYLNQIASKAGVKTYAFLFSQTTNDPSVGVPHAAEIPYVFGAPEDTSASAIVLSTNIVDYWISFATSLDPNDGRGSKRPTWPQYIPKNEVVLQLKGLNTTTIPDDYRREQIALINDYPLVFRHRRSL